MKLSKKRVMNIPKKKIKAWAVVSEKSGFIVGAEEILEEESAKFAEKNRRMDITTTITTPYL
mgnify:CR=1 FL=1